MRRTLALLLGLVFGLTGAGPALAGEGGGQDNIVVAENTTDGSSLFAFAFDLRRVAGPVLEQTNAAIAYASCEDCRTVAIAIQVLIVQGDPEEVRPVNAAIAVNEECTSCDTLASAHQIVIGGDGPLRLTRDGRHQIRELEAQLRALEDSDASIEELQAQVDALVDELEAVLIAELVPAGPPDGPGPRGPPGRESESETEEGDDDEGDRDELDELSPAAATAEPVEDSSAPVEETSAPVEATPAPVEETSAPASEPVATVEPPGSSDPAVPTSTPVEPTAEPAAADSTQSP